MRILVAYGSKRGGTAGLAQMIGKELTALGYQATVKPAGEVRALDDVDAAIIAGALYAGRWHRDARSLVRQQADRLRGMPVWLVASGPLDDSAATREIPPVRHVAWAAARIGARGQVTFGGRLAPDATGFMAAAMAKKRSGDWRDLVQIKTWVGRVAESLNS
ncbi:MAG TPA: flavodoxin domain-containing protein [Actinospica sp.]|jgi:menaquinone-dependent protoporphyrinogen oxidase|nr:flavodoxin domain-containing protein [Actinospica sp.]